MKKKPAATILILVAFVLSSVFFFLSGWHRLGIVPEGIKTSEIVIDGDQTGIDSCGAVIYKLHDDTVVQINQAGLDFLQGKVNGRFYNTTYAEWTAQPNYKTQEDRPSFTSGLGCLENANQDPIVQTVIKNAYEKNNFFTHSLEPVEEGVSTGFIIIPKLRMLVFSYFEY